MIVAGIDFDSFAIHVVLLELDDNEAHYHCLSLDAPGDALDRCRRVRDVLPSRGSWNDSGVIAIGLERPMGPSRLGSHAMMRVQGAILACLPREPLVEELPPNVWKKATVGRGNATKEDARAWALERWPGAGEEALPQDAYDAFCIAWALRSRLSFGEVAA